MSQLALINDDMIITLPFATSYWIVFKGGHIESLQVHKYQYPLCRNALNLDHLALPTEVLNFAALGEVSFIIANVEKPYGFMDKLRKLQSDANKFGEITNPLTTLSYLESQNSFKLSSSKKVNLIKLCNLLQTEMDYATLSLTIKNDEIMNRLSMSSRSLTAAMQTLKDLEFISIQKRSFKNFSLPQRIVFNASFFEQMMAITEDELERVQQATIKSINEMVLQEYINERIDKKLHNKHYLAIAELIEAYESISQHERKNDLTTNEGKLEALAKAREQLTKKIEQVSSAFIERQNTFRQIAVMKRDSGDENTLPYCKTDILKAYDTVEISMQRTKEKAKALMLNLGDLGIKDPRIIKAIANLL
tara:strand:+ start:567 stop:1655 length:1089 start_codon:yes stop_codon:yes gene_type:complete